MDKLMFKCGILLGDKFEDIDFFIIYALLNKAADYIPIELTLISYKENTVSKCNVSVATTPGTKSVSDYDTLIIPGSNDFRELKKDKSVNYIIKRHIGFLKPIYVICSGIDLLLEMDLIKGFKISTHYLKRQKYRERDLLLSNGIERDRWLISVGGHPNYIYLKSVEGFYQIVRDHFPQIEERMIERIEVRPSQHWR
jgi:putative intracellular protease/amidase